MRKVVIAFVAAAVLTFASAASVLAASPNHALPGTPGDANCHGQSAAYAAQLAANLGVPDANGVGGIARASGVSVQDVQALLDAYCAGA